MSKNKFIIVVFVSFVVFGLCSAEKPKLRSNFYRKSCPKAEQIVKDITWKRTEKNPALGAKLLRMHFHDCFVRGCDGSILLDGVGSDKAEKDTIPNQSLLGFDVIDEIKDELERVCPETVSCADILALSARDAVSYPLKKPRWDVQTGRRDGLVSLASDVDSNIPSPFADFESLKKLFKSKNLDVDDLVVLSGGHTIGVAHCATFSTRLNNFTGKGDMDPSLNSTYAEFLKSKCPNPANPSTTVEMDPESSLSFDSNYYSALLQNKGLFQSDAALLANQRSAKLVRKLQRSNGFYVRFAVAMKKMGSIGVLTGNDGQIRKNCRVVNPETQGTQHNLIGM